MNGFDLEARELTSWEERLADMSPLWPAVQRFFNETKDRDFRSGQGPAGPHRPLRPSTRRGHRTGVPLYNTGQLRRSFCEPSHGQYRWTEDEAGWEHASLHPALPHLARKGYMVTGLNDENWRRIDDAIHHYLDTGEVRRIQ